MTNLLKKTNRSSRSARAVGFSLACLLVGISAIAYGQNRAVVEKQDLSKAKAIAIAQPLAFEANQGQADQSVKFLARARGYAASVTSNESIVRLNNDTAIRMKLRNGNPSPKVQGEDLQSGKSNYLLGSDRSKWIVGVPHYAKVRAKDVYPGIDAVYSGNERQIEYDFVVRPGADPAQIRMSFDGAGKIAINRDGDLELYTDSGVMRAHRPVVYQTIDGKRKPVSGDFVLLAKNEAGFRVGPYETSRTLVIDPTLIVLANVGGALDDEGFAIAANNTGIVLTGRTKSVNTDTPEKLNSGFPEQGGIQGQHSVPGGSWDVFVTKFTIDPITGMATLAYSTFLGTPFDEAGTGVALDSVGNAYIGGYTNSPSLFPTPVVSFSGVYDAFVVELPASGASITAATYLGGLGTTQAFSLALGSGGNVVIGGLTNGLAPAPGGSQGTYGGGTSDGFVATLAPGALTLVASTYLGGSQYDQVNAVTVGADGSIYAAGFTASGNSGGGGNFPTKSAINVGNVAPGGATGPQRAFAAKFNSSLSSLSYSSIFGTGGETANGIAVDVDGVAYVVGATKNPNFSNAAQAVCGTNPQAGTLPTAATSGTAIQYTGLFPCNFATGDPGQTQGFLLSLTGPSLPGVSPSSPGGAIKYLDLQSASVHDPANAAGCNLNLTKNGGSFSSGSACLGFFGSWNGVATDSDEQAYTVGQWNPSAAILYADWYRFTRVGGVNLASTWSGVLNGVAVNGLRQGFAIGTSSLPTGGPGYRVGSVVAPDSIQANGGEDVEFIGIQWNDVFVTPSVIALGPAAINSSPQPFVNVTTANSAGVAVFCTLASNTDPTHFGIAAIPSTNAFTITLSTASVGVFNAVATFSCPGADNGNTTLTMTGSVTGNLVVAPSAGLIATSQIGSGILQPYNTAPGNATITVDVSTAVGSIPFKVSESGASANWPTCGLIGLSAPTGPALPPTSGTNSFNITINSNCASQLAVGVYTENIAVASTTAGLAPTVNLPFSLTITSGGVIVQYLPNFVFGASTTPQVGAFTVQAPVTSPLTYLAVFGPWNNSGVTPLPAANATILSGRNGTIPANGSAVVSIQISPAGLATGVYAFCYAVTSVTLAPNAGPTSTCAYVYVGTGLGFVSPAGGVLNISVPAGFAPASLTQPPAGSIVVTGLANYQSSPYSVAAPTITASTFTPALPAGAFQISPSTGSCTTYAQVNPSNLTLGPWCYYSATVDTTSLTPGTYTGTVAFKSGTTTANLTVNLTVTQYPQLLWVDQNAAPQPSITFRSVAGLDTTLCSNNFPYPGVPYLTSTGGVIPNVTETISPNNSWMGLDGNQGTPGNLGNTNPGGIVWNPVQAPGFYGRNICVSAANIHTPGTYTGTLTASGSGVGSTATLQVNFIVSGTGVSNVGVFRAGFYWLLDANGNTLWDGTGAGLDIATPYGGLPGDVPITGDWSGTGTTKIGIYRASTGQFLLDYNDNGSFDGCLADRCFQFFPAPVAGDIPVVGDWTGTGSSKIGIYRPSTGQWFLDMNGNGIFDGADVVTNFGGLPGDVPVTGDWTGNGITKIGIFRASFFWILDTNGNGTFDAGDAAFPFGGDAVIPGDVPVVGDWNGSGTSKVGVFRLGFFWVLDTNGDHLFTVGEQAFPFGGLSGDVPVVGKWRKP